MRRLPWALAGSLWFAVVCLFFWQEHPLYLGTVGALLRPMGLLLASLVFAVACRGWGTLALGRLGVTDLDPLDDGVTSTGLGMALLALGAFCLGAAGLLHPLPLALLLGAGCALALRARGAAVLASGMDGLRPPREMLLPLGLILIAGVLVTTQALLPSNDHDLLHYHLPIVERFLSTGDLSPVPEIEQSHLPRYGHLVLLYGFAFLGPLGVNLPGLLAAILAAGATAMLARRIGLGPTGRAWAVAFFSCSWLVQLTSHGGHVDLFTSLFDAIALCLILDVLKERWPNASGPVATAALLLGVSIGCKLLPLVGLASAAAILWSGLASAKGWRRATTSTLLLVALAAVVAAPWFVQNLRSTGNPVHPLFGGFFARDGEALFRARYVAEQSRIFRWSRHGVARLLQPWDATVYGHCGGMPFWDAVLDPWFLGLAPLFALMVLFGRKDGEGGTPIAQGRRLAFHGLFVFLVCTSATPFTRYGMQVLPVLSAAAAGCLVLGFADGLSARMGRATAALALAAALAAHAVALVDERPLSFFLHPMSADAHRALRLPLLGRLEAFCRDRLPPDARLYLLWMKRGWGLGRPYRVDATGAGWAFMRHEARSDGERLEALRAKGTTHLVTTPRVLAHWLRPLPPVLERDPAVVARLRDEIADHDAFLGRVAKKIYDDGFYQVWALPSADGGGR